VSICRRSSDYTFTYDIHGYHSSAFMFLRVRPDIRLDQPWTLLYSFYLPGSFGLFFGQGLLVLVENIFVSFASKTTLYKQCKANKLLATIISCLQSIYVYGSLIWMARWLIAECVRLDLVSGESISRMSPSAQWSDYSTFFRKVWQI
jgi:hypothetical protein